MRLLIHNSKCGPSVTPSFPNAHAQHATAPTTRGRKTARCQSSMHLCTVNKRVRKHVVVIRKVCASRIPSKSLIILRMLVCTSMAAPTNPFLEDCTGVIRGPNRRMSCVTRDARAKLSITRPSDQRTPYSMFAIRRAHSAKGGTFGT